MKNLFITIFISILINNTANAQLARVYIVDNKKTTVYHTNRQCKQLLNAENPIIEISIQEAQSKYRKCHFCKNQTIKKKQNKHVKKKTYQKGKKKTKTKIKSKKNAVITDSLYPCPQL